MVLFFIYFNFILHSIHYIYNSKVTNWFTMLLDYKIKHNHHEKFNWAYPLSLYNNNQSNIYRHTTTTKKKLYNNVKLLPHRFNGDIFFALRFFCSHIRYLNVYSTEKKFLKEKNNKKVNKMNGWNKVELIYTYVHFYT